MRNRISTYAKLKNRIMYVVLNRVIADIRICGGKKTNIFVFVFGEKNAYADIRNAYKAHIYIRMKPHHLKLNDQL